MKAIGLIPCGIYCLYVGAKYLYNMKTNYAKHWYMFRLFVITIKPMLRKVRTSPTENDRYWGENDVPM